MITKEHLVKGGLPEDKAHALAAAGSGMTWQQWLQFILAILGQLGGALPKK